MGKSASEVRSEIEDTRQEMSETIDAIADRTSPGRIIQRRRQRMSDGWRSVRERVMGRAEDTVGSAGDRAHGSRAPGTPPARSSRGPAKRRGRCSSRCRATRSPPVSSPSAEGCSSHR